MFGGGERLNTPVARLIRRQVARWMDRYTLRYELLPLNEWVEPVVEWYTARIMLREAHDLPPHMHTHVQQLSSIVLGKCPVILIQKRTGRARLHIEYHWDFVCKQFLHYRKTLPTPVFAPLSTTTCLQKDGYIYVPQVLDIKVLVSGMEDIVQQSTAIGQGTYELANVHPLHTLLQKAGLTHVLRRILGNAAPELSDGWLRVKHAGTYTALHADEYYYLARTTSRYKRQPIPRYTCWIPLNDTIPHASHLYLLPTSHINHQRYVPTQTTPSDFHVNRWACKDYVSSQQMRVGDVLLFSTRVIHGATTHLNASVCRRSIDVRLL